MLTAAGCKTTPDESVPALSGSSRGVFADGQTKLGPHPTARPEAVTTGGGTASSGAASTGTSTGGAAR